MNLALLLAALWCGGRDFRRCDRCKCVTPWHKDKCMACGKGGT